MTTVVHSSTQAAPNMTPGYDVKLLLKPTAVLGSNKELTCTVMKTFDMTLSITKLNVPVSRHDLQGHLYHRLERPHLQD
jgi:hypothetical protein